MTALWIVLIGCWVAVAAERYVRYERRKRATELAFLAESTEEAHAIMRQRQALQQAIHGAADAREQVPHSAQLPGVTMQPNDQHS